MAKKEESGLNALLRSVAAGHLDAIVEIWDIVFDKITGFILARFQVFDESEVEGIISRTILKLMEKAYQYRGTTDKQAMNYIFTIAKNIAIDLAKKKGRTPYLDDLLIDPQGAKTTDELMDELLSIQEPHSKQARSIEDQIDDLLGIEELIDELTEREREVLSLLAEGYSQREIAMALGVTPGRVSQLVRKIREKGINLR